MRRLGWFALGASASFVGMCVWGLWDVVEDFKVHNGCTPDCVCRCGMVGCGCHLPRRPEPKPSGVAV